VLGALGLQFVFAVLVLRWSPGQHALGWASDRVASLIGYTQEGTAFVFGPLLEVGDKDSPIFALQVLPVIVFLGALSRVDRHPDRHVQRALSPERRATVARLGLLALSAGVLANFANAAIAGVVVSF
jgi:nucleoside permease NupC